VEKGEVGWMDGDGADEYGFLSFFVVSCVRLGCVIVEK
jgi:hypothetical protein